MPLTRSAGNPPPSNPHFSDSSQFRRLPLRSSLKPGMNPGNGSSVPESPRGKALFRDFQIDFVQMPSRMGFGSAFAQVRCDHRPEMVHPAPDGLIGDHDPAFRQQIFDVAEAQLNRI